MDHKASDVRQRLINFWKYRNRLTQAEAAERMGITQSALNQYLTGRIPLNTDIIIKFAKVMDLYPYEINPDLNWETFKNET